jgi:hypothetical protein
MITFLILLLHMQRKGEFFFNLTSKYLHIKLIKFLQSILKYRSIKTTFGLVNRIRKKILQSSMIRSVSN